MLANKNTVNIFYCTELEGEKEHVIQEYHFGALKSKMFGGNHA